MVMMMIILIIIDPQVTHWYLFTYPFLTPCSLSPDSFIIISLFIPYSVLFVASWWLFYPYRCLLTLQGSWNTSMLCKKCCLWLGKTWVIWRPKPNFAEHKNRTLINPYNRECQGKPGRMGSLSLHWQKNLKGSIYFLSLDVACALAFRHYA